MNTISPLITTSGCRKEFLMALKACQDRKQLKGVKVAENEMTPLPKILEDKNGDIKQDQLFQTTKILVNKLRGAEKFMIVDGIALEQPLLMINAYASRWNLVDDVMEKLGIVVYDFINPQKSEIIFSIPEAIRKREEFEKEEKIVFVTVNGEYMNFLNKIASNKDNLPETLPKASEVLEISPESAFEQIEKLLWKGKTVVIDKELLMQRPGLTLPFHIFREKDKIIVLD